MVLQLLRPVVLVGVLLASGPLLRRLAFTFETGFPDRAHWPPVAAVMVVFAAVAVAGRHRASPAVLAVEAVVLVTAIDLVRGGRSPERSEASVS